MERSKSLQITIPMDERRKRRESQYNKYRISELSTNLTDVRITTLSVNTLDSRDNYSATSNNMKLVHWPLMGGLLHLVQRGGAWAGPQPAQAPPRCTKYNTPPINSQCTNHRIVV